MQLRIDEIYSAGLVLGESPVWDAEHEWLYWVDIVGKSVFRSRADGAELAQWAVPLMVGALALWQDDCIILALANGFHRLDLLSGKTELLAGIPEGPDMRLNDGKVGRDGRFIAGSMQIDAKDPVGSLYLLDHDLSVEIVDETYMIPNGPCWSADGATFYCGDSNLRTIWSFDYDVATGAVSNKQVFAVLPDDVGGVCDGATVDAEGCLWSAAVFAGKLVRFSPDGSVDRIVEVPVKNVTSLNFGGSDMDVLFLTSMGESDENNGGVYAVKDLGVKGLRESRFGK
jgi:L-arabinonolactonase